MIGTIVRNLGSTLAACGDINRNVMAPAAPFEKGGYPAARRLADDIADLLSPEAAEGSIWTSGWTAISATSARRRLFARP